MAQLSLMKNSILSKIKIDIDPDNKLNLQDGDIVKAHFEVIKPDGSTTTWPATPEDQHYLFYFTQEGDLDQPRTWTIRPYVELSSGWKGYAKCVKIFVMDC